MSRSYRVYVEVDKLYSVLLEIISQSRFSQCGNLVVVLCEIEDRLDRLTQEICKSCWNNGLEEFLDLVGAESAFGSNELVHEELALDDLHREDTECSQPDH